MQKLLKHFTTLLLILAINSCGYHLRGVDMPAVDGIKIHLLNDDKQSDIGSITLSALQDIGFEITDDASQAQYQIHIFYEQLDNRATGYDITGRPNEFEISLQVPCTIQQTDNKQDTQTTMLKASRQYFHDRTSLIEPTTERDRLIEDMQKDLSNQILRKLATMVKQNL